LSACAGDPTGPGVLFVTPVGAGADTVWSGAPGEAIPSVAIRVRDGQGALVAGATITWEAVGRNAQILYGSAKTDAHGFAAAAWQLGTNAVEEQQLRITAQRGQLRRELLIHARAVPHVVGQLRVSVDSPAVLRVGDSLRFSVTAIDPYGNTFPAPQPRLALTDTTMGRLSGAVVIGGPKRGALELRVTSNYVTTRVPLRVVQYVASMTPIIDKLEFTSLRAQLPIKYVLHDDKGNIVTDTVAQAQVVDTSIALIEGDSVRSVGPGATVLRLSVGAVVATVGLGVEQRVASLAFARDTIRFDALHDTSTIQPIARDSLGSLIPRADLAVEVTDSGIVTMASRDQLKSIRPGLTIVTVRDPTTGIATSSPVVVRQVITAIQPSLARLTFDAVGDSASVTATATDRLGSLVAGAVLDFSVSDSSVVSLTGVKVRSMGPGQGSLTVRDHETGTTATVPVVVDQVATSLTVSSTFGNSVATLAVGVPFPLSCRAVDRNGYAIARDPVLVGSRKGTVTGSGCADARVAHSGYDTLMFASGNVQVPLAVIIATAPDSVGVLAAAQPLTTVARDSFVGEDLGNPLILALRPLLTDILLAYGSPVTNLDRARAIRDWVSRTAVHPFWGIHPDGSTSNVSVLPAGTTWADVNPVSMSKIDADAQYWGGVGMNGYAMLDRLLGTLDPATGVRADDGMMAHVGGARYEIRDIASYHYVLCSYQDIILEALWAAAGLHGMLISTVGHDPAAVFIPELGRWVYDDPEFNEEYFLDGTGEPLSPIDLLSLSSAGEAGRLIAEKRPGPTYDPEVYVAGASYISGSPTGYVIMGSQLNNRLVGVVLVGHGSWPVRYVQIDVPQLADQSPFNDPITYARVTGTDAFPTLGVVVQALQVQDSVYTVQLGSTFPNHQSFQRRVNGTTWENVRGIDVLPVGACRVEYRSVDAAGNISASAALDAWIPRAAGFVEAAAPGSVRSQARYCV